MKASKFVPFMLRRGDGSTLSLDFTAMSGLDSRFTFTRSSTTSTYINSSGLVTTAGTNVPRFDYDPTTLAPRGLLIEGSATNELTNSNAFTSAGWFTSGSGTKTITTSYATGPDGVANSASRFQFDQNCALKQLGGSTGTNYANSIWVKSNTGSATTLAIWSGTAAITVNVTTSWTRVQGVSNHSSGPGFDLYNPNSGTCDVLIWGAQREAGSGASSYIPTGASTVQRAADSCQLTGTNFSSWFGSPTSATVYAEAFANVIPPASNFPGVWLMNKSGTARNYGFVRHTNGALRVAGFNAATGGSIVDIETSPNTTVTAGTRFKHAVAMTDLNWAYAANAGSGVNTNTNTTVYFDETVDSLTIGLAPGQLGSHTIAKLKYWPIALPTATLQALTA